MTTNIKKRLSNVPKLKAKIKLCGCNVSEEELKIIKNAVDCLPCKEQKQIIKKRYFSNEYTTDIAVYVEMNMSESCYYRMKKEALETLGWLLN